MPIELLFNPNLMEFVNIEKGSINGEMQAEDDASKGIIRLSLSNVTGLPDGKTTLARVQLKSKRPGISYLIYKAPTYTNEAGETQRAHIRASRIVIK